MTSSILIQKEITCQVCRHKWVWKSDGLTVKLAMIYNAWLDIVVDHLKGCQIDRMSYKEWERISEHD